jgi:hypothetical protein
MMNQPPQPPLQPALLPKKGTRVVLFLLSFIFIITGLMGILIGHALATTRRTTTIAGTPTAPRSPAKVGDTITIENISCTLTSVSSLYDLVIIAHVKLVNNSHEEIEYDALDFHLKTEEGQILDPLAKYSALGIGELLPSEKVEGNIFFDIAHVHKAEILWQPGGTEDLSYEWDFVLTS